MALRNGVVQRGAVKLDHPINFITSSFKSRLPPSQSPRFALRRSSPVLFGSRASKDDGAVRLRPRNAKEIMADVAQMSALRHMAFRLSSRKLLPGLSFGPARAPSPAHTGPPHSGSLPLFESQSIRQ
ncbi:hypothetical protein DVH24_030617 [Malus domestica]|uniref:Uncharacterized protein n=1 Tax=Malus domestica TaxID=3750 RepID=A0A498JYG6_MALDO|nr:hypothetical protein DVH24_030617 [Malus domestica]